MASQTEQKKKRVKWSEAREKMNREEFFSYKVQTQDALNHVRARLFYILLNGHKRPVEQGGFPIEVDENFLNDIWGMIKDSATTEEAVLINEEIKLARKALKDGYLPRVPAIKDETSQLVWGAAFLYLRENFKAVTEEWPEKNRCPKQTLRGTQFWRDFVAAKNVKRELTDSAFWASTEHSDKKTKMRWGTPGSWFYWNPEQNLINIDIAGSLILGFHDSRAVIFHEIGHSKYTQKRKYPPTIEKNGKKVKTPPNMRMHNPASIDALYQEIEQLEERIKASKKERNSHAITEHEYREKAVLYKRIELRHQLWNAMEDNCVNRFVAYLGRRLDSDDLRNILPYDFGLSMNLVETIIVDKNKAFGLKDMAKPKGFLDAKAESANQNIWEKYSTLLMAMNLSFFMNNGFFENNEEGWASVGVSPEKLPRPAGMDGWAALNDINDHMDGKPDSLSCQQPLALTRIEKAKVDLDALGQKRADIAEAMLQKYYDVIEEELIADFKDMLEKEIEDFKNKKRNKDQQQQQDGQGGEGGQQSGDSQPSSGSSSGGGGEAVEFDDDDLNQPDEQEKQDQQQDDGLPRDEHEEQRQRGSGEDSDQQQDAADKGEKGKEQDSSQQEQKDGQDGGQGKEGAAQDDQKQEGSAGEGADGTVDVEGVGSLPDPAAGSKHHREFDDEDPEAENISADDAADDGATMEDLINERNRQQHDSDKANERAKEAMKNAARATQAGEGGRPPTLDELPLGDFSDYQARVAQLAPYINMVARQLENLRKKQEEEVIKRAKKERTLFPIDGDFGRMDDDHRADLKIKQKTGLPLDIEDFEHYEDDFVKQLPTDISIFVLIDGSGSMMTSVKNKSGSTAFESALLSGVILYEAAKKVGIDVHIGIWGPSTNPPVIASPNDNPQDIGRRIMGIINTGLNSGTDLAPAIEIVPEALSKLSRRDMTAGFTHGLILSDGDIFDPAEAAKNIEILFEHCERLTLDFGIITGSKKNTMVTVAKSLKTKHPSQKITVRADTNPATMASELIATQISNIRRWKSFIAKGGNRNMMVRKKQKQMKKARDAMRALKNG